MSALPVLAVVTLDVALVLVGFAIAGIALIALLWRLRQSRIRSNVDRVCRDALVIVDLLAPPKNVPDMVSNQTLSAVSERLRLLGDESRRGARSPVGDRVDEALGELQQVALKLSAALEAERARRLTGDANAGHADSGQRIAKRTSELDLAARQVIACGRA